MTAEYPWTESYRAAVVETDRALLKGLHQPLVTQALFYSFEYGSGIGLDVVLILMALQPVIVAGHFSSGSNDTRQINWQTILFFGFALVLLVIMLVATFMMFIVPTFLVQAVAIAAVFTMSLAGWAGYKLLLERGRIDLLSRPRPQ